MSFQQGLSGLNAASTYLDTVGNNVANSNTVGFKSGRAVFADVYASAMSGASNTDVGIGVRVAQVDQKFTTGPITSSTRSLDVAINGDGFFRMSDNGAITYSRNGQFTLNTDGHIINSNGSRLTGYMADATGTLSTGALTDILISTADLNPRATTEVSALLSLDSRETVPAVTPFNMNNASTFNNSTAVTVYDTLGNPHTVQTYYVKTAANTWDVYAACDGSVLDGNSDGDNDPATGTLRVASLGFTTGGALNAATAAAMPITFPTIAVTTGAAPLSFTFNYTGTKQTGTDFSVNTLTQDGYKSGSLSGFTIGDDGIILGNYTNEKTAVLGQVVLATFTNPNGLQPLGNNEWTETSTSGQPLVNTPSAGKAGVLQASAVEESNVDLTAELVNMITAQRYYQANAQTIQTQDEIMQTLVNL